MFILKKSLFYIFALVIISQCTKVDRSDEHDTAGGNAITVMTYNIKYDDKSNTPTGWEQRKERVRDLIAFYEPDFLGTQEALIHQLQYLEANLDSMQFIGEGRDGGQQGEFSALFYNTARFQLVENSDSTLWLSPDSNFHGKAWDAAFPRILTWGKFRSRNSQNEFFVFNTHFDHVGDTARAESAKLILKTIQDVAGESPVILTGDFNVTPEAEPYAILTGNSGLKDSHVLAEEKHIGPDFTYSGFKVEPNTEKRRIDYIFLSPHFTVGRHGAISDFNSGFYPSDHLPVISEINLTQ